MMPEVFVGRDAELAQLLEVVTRAREAEPSLALIEGESGMGKTALAHRCLSLASDFTVLAAHADLAESDLDYGFIGQLARTAVRSRRSAQQPTRTEVSPSSPFMAGADLLGMIGDLQTGGPVAVLLDDVQWADRRSIEALTFMFRRLSVDQVLILAVLRGDLDRCDEPTRRLLGSLAHRLRLRLGGLKLDDVGPLAEAVGAGSLDGPAAEWLHRSTGGHALYLQTVLRDGFAFDPRVPNQIAVPPSLAAAITDQLTALPPQTRAVLEVLSVFDVRVPMARLGDAADVESPSAAVEPAVSAGLVDWFPHEPSCPVVLRHALQRDAIYASMAATRRRALHARVATIVDESASWSHRVASLEHSDETLAAQLEELAAGEAAAGRLALAATHLRWAADISPARVDRERRFLTAMMQLMLVDEAGGLSLRFDVEATSSSPLRDCVLGTMAFALGQLGDAELCFQRALSDADRDPSQRGLAATIANRLAGTYTLLGEGHKVMALGRRALDSGTLDPAAASQTRTLIAIGASQVAGPRSGRRALGHLDANPARTDPVDLDALSFRGVFSLLSGDLPQAVTDLTASLRMVRRGATFTLGLRAYFYLALAQYLAGDWDDVLLTAEQGFAAAAIHSRGYELPLLHLAAGCVPAGRGDTREATHHAGLAEEAAAVLDYGQEQLYAAMARALLCQAAGDHAGIVHALGSWLDDGVLDGRSRAYGILWRPLLVEGLIGSGRLSDASTVLELLRTQAAGAVFVQPALAWFEGWIAEERELPNVALAAYERGVAADVGDCPIYRAQLLLAYGRLLRRGGRRKDAIEHLQRSSVLFTSLRAAPFAARAEAELMACGLHYEPAAGARAMAMTSRETEVAHLVGQGMTNAEVATELFVSPKAVEYHLRNIYAKFGFRGRQELRRFLNDWRLPAPA